MRSIIVVIFLITYFFSLKTNAQQNIGIGTSNPHSSAVLDVRSTNKGLLLPRVSLINDSDVVTISSPLKSLIIYNTNTLLADGEGYYFWNGNKWNKLATRNNIDNLTWGIQGNAGTSPNSDFIGTTDNRPLVFKTNNILAGKIDQNFNNVFFGQQAGHNPNNSGINNTFIGHAAGENNLGGSNNFFAGDMAGNGNSSGYENVFVGQDAGKKNSSGYQNVFVGEDAGIENINGSQNVFVGNGAGRNNTSGSGNISVGHDAGINLQGSNSIFIGTGAGANNIAEETIAIGAEALSANTNLANTAIGIRVLRFNTSGWLNTALGYEAMESNTLGDDNTAVGGFALVYNTNGHSNTALGTRALSSNSTGNNNTALGFNSGPAFGFDNLNNTTAIGYSANVITNNTMSFGNENVDRWAFGLTTTNAQHALEVGSVAGNGNGAYLTQGGVWTNTSDINKKEAFSVLDGTDLLKKIISLPITKWKYKGTDEYHIGPMAQDFHKLFGLGTDDKGISTVDPAGIALAAIQEQQKLIEKQQELILQLQKRIELLEKK